MMPLVVKIARDRNPRLLVALVLVAVAASRAGAVDFQRTIAPILEARCVICHNAKDHKGGLSLATHQRALAGGESGEVITPGDADASLLLEFISGEKPAMPKEDDPLTAAEVKAIREWIAAGAEWADGVELKAKDLWWSRQPLARPVVPAVPEELQLRVRTPIDAFIIQKLQAQGMTLSPEADRRTLIRRLYFDLLGLPPSPEEIAAFEKDADPEAYEKLVDRLLDSPHYGERWARHWLDVVHYGDTHGFDKDKVRPHAWPYRDYVIRAFNEDKPYERFVREQLAGDVFYPESTDGIVALGFIAAGPFDFVGQIEVGNGTMEKDRVRNIDRDDMVATTMSTFVSATAHCARCHNHKFDPISQQDYYGLQAVFAAVDRANRPYEADPQIAARRGALALQQQKLQGDKDALHAKIREIAGPEVTQIDNRLAEISKNQPAPERAEFGYHSQISLQQDIPKWVQIDLGKPQVIEHLIYVACHDDFNNIGAGFGFPVRYKIAASNDAQFASGVQVVVDRTAEDVPNPGVRPNSVALDKVEAQYIRITATKLAPRQNDFIFALAEMSVLGPDGKNLAVGAKISSLDSIEAGVRWRMTNLIDGYYYGVSKEDHSAEIVKLNAQRDEILRKALDDTTRKQLAELDASIKKTEAELASLPAKGMVYAAATSFANEGNFVPSNAVPRPIFLLKRGSETAPDKELGPIAPAGLSALAHLNHHFDLPPEHAESARRAALAGWIVDKQNPLTWRSIVNRVWQYHFGRGIVDSPDDFGRMGTRPTHPELLSWLAVEFRDGGQSLKKLHQLIVTSSTYRQSSASNEKFAALDGGNRFLWRANRRKLEAEAVRDSVLAVAGKLDPKLGGPGFQAFGFKDDHSPHYTYQDHDPDNPATHRRSIYRFIVRSVPDPFMTTLDCADPSLNVARRNETLTALQALALLNNKFVVRMAEHFAMRVDAMGGTNEERINAAIRLALGRDATPEETQILSTIATEHGLASACRVIFNLNEFVFVD
jgi:hypothetical protein